MARPTRRAATIRALGLLAPWLGAAAAAATDPLLAVTSAPAAQPTPAAAHFAAEPPTPQTGGDTASRRITGIRWQGLHDVTEETALFHLGIAPGDPLDPGALNRGLHDLWQSGLFDDLELHTVTDGADAVLLEIRLEERPRLVAIEIEGLDWATRAEVETWLREQDVVPAEPAPLDRGLLIRLADQIERRVRLRGQRRSRASYRLEPAGDGAVRAVFTLERSPPVRIESIEFAGNRAFDAARLRRAMRYNQQGGPLRRLLRLDDLDREGLEADLQTLRALYRNQGYKDVVLYPPRIETVTGDPGRVRVTIRLEEGERWALGGLSVSGNRAFSDQRLLALFERPRGGRLRHAALEAWREAIETLYLRHGRLATRVALELRERPDNVADAVARVEEGEAVRLAELEIEGNTRTREAVLRREIALDEGDLLDVVALRASLARIERAGLFDFADDPVTFREATEGDVDVVLSGREADPFRTGFGGGWSETDGLSTHLFLETPNLLGRGLGAGLRFETGGNREGLELSLTLPWVLHRRQALGFELFDRRTDYSLSSGQRTFRDERGGAVGWVRALGEGQTLRLRYTRSSLADEQRGIDADGGEIRRSLALDSSVLRAAWAVDRRDDPLVPRRGLRVQVVLEAAGGGLGGDNRYLKPELAVSFHPPLGGRRGPGLAFKLAGGRIGGRGSLPPSPLETYFLGGPHSLRGFANRSIAPRDAAGQPLRDESGFVLGGDSFLEAGAEASLPLGGPFRAAVFIDAGSAWGDGQSVNLSGLRYSTGAELRVAIPRIGLPLRLIWAANPEPLPGDRFDRFTFSFGGGF